MSADDHFLIFTLSDDFMMITSRVKKQFNVEVVHR